MDMHVGPAGDLAEIGALFEARRRALHARDAASIGAQFTEDLLVFDLAPPLATKGAAREAANLRDWIASKRGPIEEELQDLRITCSGDVAFATALARLRVTDAADGRTSALWMRVTVGLVRREGTWCVAHLHGSVPFHMDGSLHAAVDLMP
jgi:ketosteroid isomerase-like protein